MASQRRISAWAAALTLMLCQGPGPVAADTILNAIVLDGDTIQIDGRVIHLYGIDAPELGQHCQRGDRMVNCGLTAAFELNKFIGMQIAPVDCVSRRDSPGGDVQVCTVSHENIAKVMLRNGSVRALPNSDPDYLEAERYARVARLGLWHMKLVPPWEWRAGKRLPDEFADEGRPCPIKGEVRNGNDRVFYVVTDAEYWQHHIDPSRGERYFCSLDAAWKAGWRHAGERKRARSR